MKLEVGDYIIYNTSIRTSLGQILGFDYKKSGTHILLHALTSNQSYYVPEQLLINLITKEISPKQQQILEDLLT